MQSLKKVALLNKNDRRAVEDSLDELSRILGIVDVDFAGSTSSLVALHEELSQRLSQRLDA